MTLTAVTALVLGGVSLSGGRGGVTGALLGAVNLFLIGYVLSTFNFGAIQAFVTQMSYGIILVLSLLLTLLVPIIGRHIAFLSPWGTFIVLATVVAGIMLQVATSATYLPAEGVAPAPAADLMTRYLLLPPTDAASIGIAFSPIQQIAFFGVLLLAALTFAAKLMTAEARAVRMNLFLYLFVAAMVALLFAVIALQGGGVALAGGES
jgi:ribose transport system permease protein